MGWVTISGKVWLAGMGESYWGDNGLGLLVEIGAWIFIGAFGLSWFVWP